MHNRFGLFFYAYPKIRHFRYLDNEIHQSDVLLLRYLEYGEYTRTISYPVTFLFSKTLGRFDFHDRDSRRGQFFEKIESDRNLFLKSTEYDNELY